MRKEKKPLAEFHRERTASGSVRYAEQQTSMDITTAISADRDWDGKELQYTEWPESISLA